MKCNRFYEVFPVGSFSVNGFGNLRTLFNNNIPDEIFERAIGYTYNPVLGNDILIDLFSLMIEILWGT